MCSWECSFASPVSTLLCSTRRRLQPATSTNPNGASLASEAGQQQPAAAVSHSQPAPRRTVGLPPHPTPTPSAVRPSGRVITFFSVGPAPCLAPYKPETRIQPSIQQEIRRPSHVDPLSICTATNELTTPSSSPSHPSILPPPLSPWFTGPSARITSISERASPYLSIYSPIDTRAPPVPPVPPSLHPRVLLAADAANHSHLSVIPDTFQSIVPLSHQDYPPLSERLPFGGSSTPHTGGQTCSTTRPGCKKL
jgi:hypothetical protein